MTCLYWQSLVWVRTLIIYHASSKTHVNLDGDYTSNTYNIAYWFFDPIGITTDSIVYSIVITDLPFYLEGLGYAGVSGLVGWLLFAYVSSKPEYHSQFASYHVLTFYLFIVGGFGHQCVAFSQCHFTLQSCHHKTS